MSLEDLTAKSFCDRTSTPAFASMVSVSQLTYLARVLTDCSFGLMNFGWCFCVSVLTGKEGRDKFLKRSEKKFFSNVKNLEGPFNLKLKFSTRKVNLFAHHLKICIQGHNTVLKTKSNSVVSGPDLSPEI